MEQEKQNSDEIGQYELFQQIWAERPHRCTVCRKPLPVFNVRYFAHVLGKKAYPRFRVFEGNIIILCGICHTLFDHYTHKTKDKKAWEDVWELFNHLKEMYNNLVDGKGFISSNKKES